MKKKYRIHKNEEFQTILKNKQFISSPTMVLYIRLRKFQYPRIGITVSKKIGNAVVRNKIKRQIRMMCQDVFLFDEPYDMIIMVRRNYLEKSYQENLDTLKGLKEKMMLIRRKK